MSCKGCGAGPTSPRPIPRWGLGRREAQTVTWNSERNLPKHGDLFAISAPRNARCLARTMSRGFLRACSRSLSAGRLGCRKKAFHVAIALRPKQADIIDHCQFLVRPGSPNRRDDRRRIHNYGRDSRTFWASTGTVFTCISLPAKRLKPADSSEAAAPRMNDHWKRSRTSPLTADGPEAVEEVDALARKII